LSTGGRLDATRQFAHDALALASTAQLTEYVGAARAHHAWLRSTRRFLPGKAVGLQQPTVTSRLPWFSHAALVTSETLIKRS